MGYGLSPPYWADWRGIGNVRLVSTVACIYHRESCTHRDLQSIECAIGDHTQPLATHSYSPRKGPSYRSKNSGRPRDTWTLHHSSLHRRNLPLPSISDHQPLPDRCSDGQQSVSMEDADAEMPFPLSISGGLGWTIGGRYGIKGQEGVDRCGGS